MGPVQVLVVGFDRPVFSGEVMAEFARLREAGIVRLAHAVPPGSAAAVALIEHVWAEPLTAAIRRAGGRALEETWLAPGDLAAPEAMIAGDPAARPADRPPGPTTAEELR